jgi:hypothetical protein
MKVMIPTVTPVKKGFKPRLRTSVLIDAGDSSGTGAIATGSVWYASDRSGVEEEDIAISEIFQSWRRCHPLFYSLGCDLNTSTPDKRALSSRAFKRIFCNDLRHSVSYNSTHCAVLSTAKFT